MDEGKTLSESIDYGKLNPDVKAAWIAALRSGSYEQGTSVMKQVKSLSGSLDDCKYCCLGVLLEIKGVPSRLAGMVSYCFQDKNGFNLRTALDDTLRHRYGLTILAQGKLIQMNDSDAKSFPAIADWIEETL